MRFLTLLIALITIKILLFCAGMSLPADDNTDQDLNRIAYTNSFIDPHIGSDHAWAEWDRIVGNVSLLVGAAFCVD